MKKLICLASFLLCIQTVLSQPSIPSAFTVLNTQNASPVKSSAKDLLQQEKAFCIFYILISAPIETKGKPVKRDQLYKNFAGLTKNEHGAIIPEGFITTGSSGKPSVPITATVPMYFLHFGWADKGGKNTLTEAADAFAKALANLHRTFKKTYTCYYIVVTEGKSGLLVNYATQQSLKRETFSLSVVVEIGTPLPAAMEKTTSMFYPNLSKIGTLYSFYTQHNYLSSSSHFPPSPETSYPTAFVNKSKNMYNIRLLLNNNQQSLQHIFEKHDMKQSIAYLGQHLFEFCNYIKRFYTQHHDLWANLDTKTNKPPYVGIISHSSPEKESKPVRQEHQRAGKQLDAFQNKTGNNNRIQMSTGQKMRSTYRPVAQLKKLQKLTCQTA